MARSKTKKPQAAQSAGAAAPGPKSAAAPIRPGGKLGLIIERLEAKAGATVGELAGATGWQRHTVHGALSRLRSRGFAMHLQAEGDRKAYRLARARA